MIDYFKNMEPVLKQMLQEMKRLSPMYEFMSKTTMEKLQDSLDSNMLQQQLTSGALEASAKLALAKNFVGANNHIQNLIEKAAESKKMMRVSEVHDTWVEQMKPTQDSIDSLQLRAQKMLEGITDHLPVATALLSAVDFGVLGKQYNIEDPIISKLKDSIFNLSTSYKNLTESFKNLSDVTTLPSFILPGATNELYMTGYVLGQLKPHDSVEDEKIKPETEFSAIDTKQESDIIDLLKQVDPRLVNLYNGAREALRGKNVDRTRHVLVSLRELCSLFLKCIAPDEFVISWIEQNNIKDYNFKKNPPRKAKIDYICRQINHNPLTEFLIDDTNAFLKHYKILNQIHEMEIKLSDELLHGIFLRIKSWLVFIFQIWQNSVDNA